MYFVYILRTSRNTLYIGQTSDLRRRLKEHQEKSPKAAKYTKGFSSVELVYSEICQSRSEALKREYALKQLTRTQKERLIDSHKDL